VYVYNVKDYGEGKSISDGYGSSQSDDNDSDAESVAEAESESGGKSGTEPNAKPDTW
jgi:hypothetical protein